MFYRITLNMPSHNDSLVHQILGEHPAPAIAEFMEELADQGYVIVTEYYSNADKTVFPKRDVAISFDVVGKVSVDERL